jgi:hypothetical protein
MVQKFGKRCDTKKDVSTMVDGKKQNLTRKATFF